MANIRDVAEFQRKFEMLQHIKPVHLTRRKLNERIECMQEELNEFQEGVDEQDLVKQADALIDLVYFALGTADSMGLPWDWLWHDVHRANMAKERGTTHRGHMVDCIKPEGWTPPKTLLILEAAGYNKEIDSKEENHRDDACHVSQADNI